MITYDYISNAKRIAIVGCSASGKSHLAIKLAEKLSLPCYHLDYIFWKPNWVQTPTEIFDRVHNEIVAKDEWIIDGNNARTLNVRLDRADVIIFLDMPTELCLKNEQARRGKSRVGLPSYLEEQEDAEFIDHIKNFNNVHRTELLNLFEEYPLVKIITFNSHEEVNEFFNLI